MASFKFDRKWQLLCGLFSFILIDFNIAINKKVANKSVQVLCGKMAQGFKNVIAFALYLNLPYLAKSNLSQALFKIYMKFDVAG